MTTVSSLLQLIWIWRFPFLRGLERINQNIVLTTTKTKKRFEYLNNVAYVKDLF